MLWLAVVRIIAILYFIVCHPVMLPGSNTFKMLSHGLLPVLLSSLTLHPAWRHFIGYLLDNKLSSKPLFLCTSTSLLASLSILLHISPCTNQPWTQDALTPKMCSSSFLIIVLPSIKFNQRFTSTTVSHMMPQVMEWSSTWYMQCSKSLMFQKSTNNLLISEIISTIVSNYRTPDCLPGCDLEYV